MQTETETPTEFYSVNDYIKRRPAFTKGGLRHLFFHQGEELERAGAIVRFGARILIDDAAFLAWLKAGNGRHIAGRGAA
ncbi:hypothetical protein HAP93_03570 [Acidithiobacillus ferriphilus]|uniref:hypothetical protein n=1 Tax=Acidithiobacillus ferriphilus TaxID=1689834 RepID=UPI001C061E54|nr:hypothetical protein [Acidithiobacillus ferriphilus]MBU2784854.1 hypothetical protein [Acidithiobacillus ferriphilus]UEP59775.1 hypothetical protein K1Y48_03740 [Acidithiobacillus ferriphilus]